MIRALRKTYDRTGRFLSEALAWHPDERQHVAVAWGLLAGAVFFAFTLAGDPAWAPPASLGCYLVVLLAAICAIDVIPESMNGGDLTNWL